MTTEKCVGCVDHHHRGRGKCHAECGRGGETPRPTFGDRSIHSNQHFFTDEPGSSTEFGFVARKNADGSVLRLLLLLVAAGDHKINVSLSKFQDQRRSFHKIIVLKDRSSIPHRTKRIIMTVVRSLIGTLVVMAAMSARLGAFSLSEQRMEVTSSGDQSRKIEIVNESGKKLVVDWINPVTGESVPLSQDFANGEKQVVQTYVNHTFAVHEPTTSPSCGVVDGDDCGVRYITVTDSSNQVAIVKKDMKVAHKDTAEIRETSPVMVRCRLLANEDLASGYDAQAVMMNLVTCLEDAATAAVQEKNEEIAFENKIRLDISALLENHTCADPTRETTPPKEVRTWTHEDAPGQQVTRQVGILHDRPDSQIHALENFISAEECDAISEAASKKLHRGTVADGAGGSRLSEHRKAWQAGIKVPWEKEQDGDLIARVVRRIYDYTNDAVHYNLTVEGSEDLMSIQYFGKGKDSTESPDQYRPHCDGDCDGLRHKRGGRVATMVMYCDATDLLGGGTNFQNANVFVKPKVGTAAFFSYLNAETMQKESGFTSHSGCPVIEGTKRIAVHWMRHGVDKENPWDSFNTLTIQKGEEDC